MDTAKKILNTIFDFLQSIVVVLAIMVMIYLFIISPQEINGQSMDPFFHNGEYILTNKVVYKMRTPIRGDIVVFKSPRNKEIDYIKRVIGLPGETVSLKDSVFYVNGQKVEEPYIPEGTTIFGGSYLQEGGEITVPEGTYFVVGDNRPHSSDSREFGPIPLEDFIGMAFLRYWPFTRAEILPHPTYDIK
jgi:signal peptidase I